MDHVVYVMSSYRRIKHYIPIKTKVFNLYVDIYIIYIIYFVQRIFSTF